MGVLTDLFVSLQKSSYLDTAGSLFVCCCFGHFNWSPANDIAHQRVSIMLVFEATQHTGHPGARKGSDFWQKLRLHSFLVCLLLCSGILSFSSSESKSSTFLMSNLMQLLLHKSSTVEMLRDFHTIMVSFGRGDGRF